MKSVVTCGPGRLHFMQAAEALVGIGVDVHVIQGWIPRSDQEWLLRLLARLFRRQSLIAGMQRRNPPALAGRLHGIALADFLCEGLHRLFRRAPIVSPARVLRWGWQVYGWQSRRVIRRLLGPGSLRAAEVASAAGHGGRVLHVRSGAGQGGAIAYARRLGCRILVDHSIAHPAFMALALREEHARYGLPFLMGPENPFWRLVLEDCAEADLLVVNSDFVKRTFVDAGYDGSKIRVVYLGVRSDFQGIKRDYRADRPSSARPLRLLFTGAFGFRKGAAPLLAAIRSLTGRGLPVELTVVGTASDCDRLMAPHDGVPLPVRFAGHVPQDDLKRFLAEADLYVFPSSAEGCASSGMEALAAGLCVVTTVESGLPVRDGENGYLVPRQDAAALAERIAWLASEPERMRRAGETAARDMQHVTWETYARNMQAVYRELIS